MIQFQPNGLIAHDLKRPHALQELPTVVDVGAGLRPMQWFKPWRHVCIEPHSPYADRLRGAGYIVVNETAEAGLKHLRPGTIDAIYLLDVIEHMERSEGHRIIALALAAQPLQIVLYTPNGYLEQEGSPDPWGAEFGGDLWQKHRSGWTPADFPGWEIELYAKSFFATWTRPGFTAN